eukprot:1151235-Pelagomonas_calceolata.AAC.1
MGAAGWAEVWICSATGQIRLQCRVRLYAGRENTAHINKEKVLVRAKAPCIPSTKGREKNVEWDQGGFIVVHMPDLGDES